MKNRQPAWKQQDKKDADGIRPLEVVVRDNDIGQALKALKYKMSVDGILTELRRRKFAEKPSEKKRRKHREFLKRTRKSRGRAKRHKSKDKK